MYRQSQSAKLFRPSFCGGGSRIHSTALSSPRFLHATTRSSVMATGRPNHLLMRNFSDKNEKKEGDGDTKESFSEMLKKVQQSGGSEGGEDEREKGDKKSSSDTSESNSESSGKSSQSSPSSEKETDYAQVASDLLSRSQYWLHTFSRGWGETWKELVSGPPEEIKKTVGHAAVHSQKKKKKGDEEEEEEEEDYTGPQAIVLSASDKSTWESMQERLQDSPLIQEMMKNSRRFKKKAAATDIGQKAAEMGGNVQDKIHDAREFWETSQSPIVYKLSGAWESMTAPTEEGMALAAIQKLDPDFILESWAEAIKTERSEVSIRAHLEGRLKDLKPITGEGVYNKLAADIRTRKHDGIQIDTNILQMDELQVMVRLLDQEGPIILCVYMVQQINCIRNKEGEVIEGGESQVIAKYYTIAYKQVYDDDAGVSDWKIVDYHMDGNEQYY